MRPTLKYLLIVLAILLIAAIPLALQYNTGSIEGTVTNQRGPVPGASLEVRNVVTGAVLRVKTDVKGHYIATGLSPGRYSLWVQAEENQSVWLLRVTVERGRITRQDVYLGPIVSGITAVGGARAGS